MNDPIQDDVPRAGSASKNNAQSAAPSGARPAPAFDRSNGQPAPKTGVVQPTPQALPKRSGPSSILVSPRQQGNHLLQYIKAMPWEYSDMPADYVLGNTTCALFLSLKYHRLHPEYIYTRIKGLQGRYQLRIILCLVDITNHEESLRELSKTSLINNITIMLCWSYAEGGRYLELFKTYENAAPTAIKQHQSTSYSDRMVDFITTPRSINKTDAISLVSQFGSIRTAVNARHEEVAAVPGWGEKKVERWCKSVREPFRVRRAARRVLATELSIQSQPLSKAPMISRDATRTDSGSPVPTSISIGGGDADQLSHSGLAEHVIAENSADINDMSKLVGNPIAPALPQESTTSVSKKRRISEDNLEDGVMAALNKLRKPV